MLNIEQYREYCINKIGVEECFPFDDEVLVFKVGGKIFALCNINNFISINLKCNPEYAIELRETHQEIISGYHMNKKHWNTVYINGNLNLKLIFELIDHSYDLVYSSLSKKIKESIL